MQLALYHPDIPQNLGTLMRLGACMNVPVHVIEPCGFLLSDTRLRRAKMDYECSFFRHSSWSDFMEARSGRLLALCPSASQSFLDFSFQAGDVLLLGQESIGLPKDVMSACDTTLSIPMVPSCRSLNVAISAAMVLGEALRQTSLFPTRSI